MPTLYNIQTTVYRQNTDIEKIYEYASERAWKILHFHILKPLFPSIFCWYFWYFISETYIFQVSNYNLHDAYYHQCSSLFLLMVWRYIYKRQYTDKHTDIEKIYICERAERASLGNFRIFTKISKTAISFNILLVLQILCRYKWHACRLTSCVPTKLRKSIGGGGNFPLPPSGYANVHSKCVLPNNPSPICQT